MTQKILIGVGITTITLMLLAWSYLLLFGAPQGVNEIFTDLGLQRGPTPIEVQNNLPTTTNLAPLDGRLAQLTTKAVVGFVYIEAVPASTSTPAIAAKIRYAERGTGHIYEIDFGSNTETRISGTTIAKAVSAVFDDSGEAAVIVAEAGSGTSASLQAFGATSDKSTPLPPNSRNFHFLSSEILRYSVVENGQTVAYEMDTDEGTRTTLWSVPLTDINIIWTSGADFVINRPAPWLKGGIYEVDSSGLKRIVAPEYSLSATTDPSGRFILYSYFDTEQQRVVNRILDRDSGEVTNTVLMAIPEKCTYILGEWFWCASSLEPQVGDRSAITEWYRGEYISPDALWQGQSDGSAIYIDDLSITAGFDIDVTNLAGSSSDNRLFFINKINNSLWTYQTNE